MSARRQHRAAYVPIVPEKWYAGEADFFAGDYRSVGHSKPVHIEAQREFADTLVVDEGANREDVHCSDLYVQLNGSQTVADCF